MRKVAKLIISTYLNLKDDKEWNQSFAEVNEKCQLTSVLIYLTKLLILYFIDNLCKPSLRKLKTTPMKIILLFMVFIHALLFHCTKSCCIYLNTRIFPCKKICFVTVTLIGGFFEIFNRTFSLSGTQLFI